MNCLIIGYGSIGSLHAFILSELGYNVHVVSKRDIKDFSSYKSIKEAVKDKIYNYVIISKETCNHFNSFMELNKLGYSDKILIEKPIFSEVYSFPQIVYENVFVAYNLRFHPVIQRLHRFVQGRELYSIQAYVGQYLPAWRPNTDYTKSYSASKERGGGVLRDLSHELDYINWITGGWKRVAAIGGKFSNLKIDSEDIFALLLETKNCPVVSVQMNYLDRKVRREIIVNLKDYSIKADLVINTLDINGEMEKFEVDRNLTYTLQHKSILNGEFGTICTFGQGMDVLKLIHAAELAAERQEWIDRTDLELAL